MPAATAFRTIPLMWPSSAMSSGSRSSVQNAMRPGPSSGHEREQVEQVPRHRGLADQEPHPGAEALAPLFDGQRLVVRPDARGGVCLQLLAENAGCMTVDVSSAVEAELLELCRRACDDAGVVHHLRQPQNASPAHERLEITGHERSPRRFEWRSGHTRRRHEEDVELQSGRGVEQPVHSVHAEDVRDLVRVGDDGGRAERKNQLCEFVDHQLHRLEVHVRVDEAGDDVASRRIQRLVALVATDARDDAVDHCDVGVQPLASEHRQDATTLYDEVGRLVSAGDGDATLQPFHRRERNARPRCRIVAGSVGRPDRRSR